MLVPQPGWAEHDPEADWWGDFCHNLEGADCREQGRSALDPLGRHLGDRACMLPLDQAGNPLMNGVLYGVDTRAHEEIESLDAEIGKARILDLCGNALTSQSVGPKILWLKNKRPDLFARTARVVTSTTFIVERLTGRSVIDHYTAANFSPLYRVDRQEWTDTLTDRIIGLDRLPEVMCRPSGMHGHPPGHEATGLAEGTPVICGTIDAAAEALSVGVLDPGDMMVMLARPSSSSC